VASSSLQLRPGVSSASGAGVGDPRWLPPGVRRRQIGPGRHDRVDGVEHVVAQHHVGGTELALEVLHRAWADDRSSDRRVPNDEGECQVNEAHARLLGHLRQGVRGIELGLVAGAQVVATGDALARLLWGTSRSLR